jgi:TIR domain/APAF-1 helical domain/WD domain, G-beta repeat
MTHFVARSLATWAPDETSLILHDLQRDLIHKRRGKELPGLNLRLVEAWDALPKPPDAYVWRWIGYHLVQAGHKDDLRRLLLNFNYLEAKLAATDPNALIADYDYLQEDKDLQLVQSAIRLSANVLVRDQRQLASQLTGRLLGFDDNDIQALLKQAAEKAPRPSLWPLRANLTPPGGPLVRTLEGHSSSVRGVAITADGRRAVSASYDNTLRVWDLESGKELALLEADGATTSCAFSLDGQRIVAGDASGRVHLLRLVEADETKPSPSEIKISLLLREQQSTDQLKETTMPQPARDQVFISYSHEDTKWREDLEKHLKPYLRAGSIKSWSDKQISPGSQWLTEIKTALTNTKVAVLLVTPDFIASDFIHQYELGPFLKEAKQGGVRILWVPVRASSYKKTALKDYQAVLDPAQPLANMTDAERDRVWVKICEEIENAVNRQ